MRQITKRSIPIQALGLVIAVGLGLSTLSHESLWLMPSASAFSVLPPTSRTHSRQQRSSVAPPSPICFLIERPSESSRRSSFHCPLAATSSTSSSSLEDAYVDANDAESIQNLFSKYCDGDGLMSKDALQSMPPFAQLLVR